MLTVKGDSMVEAGIFDGDKLVVAKQSTAQNGEIVVALVDDSATVKTFYKEDGHYRDVYKRQISSLVIALSCTFGIVTRSTGLYIISSC